MNIKVGDIIPVVVTGITKYGFFIKIGNYDGLCHISEVSNDFVSDINNYVKINDEIYVLVLKIDNNHLTVSIKDIYYHSSDTGHIKETRKGFLPLKENLPIWIEKKMEEIKNSMI